jgi:putative peptide zinc metalloprotease protein
MSLLPALRQELTLLPAPSAIDGAPAWTLHDPARNLFFRLDWLAYEILSRWHLDAPETILQAIRSETTIDPEPADFEQVLEFLAVNELLQRHDAASTDFFVRQQRRGRLGPLQWLLHHYLFFRVPLLRPDSWLARTQAWVAPFYTRTFFLLTLAALAVGLVETSRQWERYLATLVDTFTWQGLATFGLTLIIVKFLHELGHAYTAKRFGCRVPVMGVAFLVMFPVAYTDVNEVWKLTHRRQRLAVGAAGILTELAIAAWSTLAWALLPEGHFKTAAFLLATTTWINTVLINASPFLRFDGYFLLSDWLDMPNLHARAFALGRWRLREALFRLGDPMPEILPQALRRRLLVFAYGVWVYRLVVFSGIAMLVYKYFPKPLGPFLAGVEIVWFILMPIFHELAVWRRRMSSIFKSSRSYLTLLGVALGVTLLLLPLDRRIHAQAIFKPQEVHPVVSAGDAMIAQMPVADGQPVKAGQVLFQLRAGEAAYRAEQARSKRARLEWQLQAGDVSDDYRKSRDVLREEAAKVQAELQGLQGELQRHAPTAPHDGVFFLAQPDLRPGVWVRKNEPLGLVANMRTWQVEAYLGEADLQRLHVGDQGRFYSETPGRLDVPVRVVRIDTDATRALPSPMLASVHGGAIPVRQQNRQLIPDTAVYRITLQPEGGHEPEGMRELRGRLVVQGEARAVLQDFLQSAMALWVREAGF